MVTWAACAAPAPAGNSHGADAEPQGGLRITGPAGAVAAVTIPGLARPRGVPLSTAEHTPVSDLEGPPGTWRVTVARPGGRPYRAAVRVTAGSTAHLRVPAATPAEPLIVVGGEVLPLSSDVRVVSHLDPFGLDFTRVDADAFSRRGGDRIGQIVLHADLTGSAAETFEVLANKGLSSHFAVDWDGTVYQHLDPRWRAYHAGAANDLSIGIDLNNWMRNLVREPTAAAWPPDHPARTDPQSEDLERPLSPEVRINGLRTRSWGFNDRQYRALLELTRVLAAALPDIDLAVPADAAGDAVVPTAVVPDIGEFSGIVAHWHLSPSRWDPGPGFDWARLVAGLSGHDVRRAPAAPLPPGELDTTSENPCWHTPACPLEGLCTQGRRAGSCRAGGDSDCQRSDLCAIQGQCSAIGGVCVAAAADECARSGGCLEWGFCRLLDGHCVPAGDADCARWPGCAARGECSFAEETSGCVVAGDEDCARSGACRRGKRCKARSGVCVAVDAEACRSSPGCAASGLCGWADGGRCAPTTSQHCADSTACGERGHCALVSDRCAPAARADCEASARCARVGECSRVDSPAGPVCGLRLDSDCAAMGACAAFGLCTAAAGRCVATTDVGCQASEACAARGWCRASKSRCVALDDAHCEASRHCDDAGYCRAVDGVCSRK